MRVFTSTMPDEKVRVPEFAKVAVWLALQSRPRDITSTSASTEPLLKSHVPTALCAEEPVVFMSPIAHQVTRFAPSVTPRKTATGVSLVSAGLKPIHEE